MNENFEKIAALFGGFLLGGGLVAASKKKEPVKFSKIPTIPQIPTITQQTPTPIIAVPTTPIAPPGLEPIFLDPNIQIPLTFEETGTISTFLVTGFHIGNDNTNTKAPVRVFFLGKIPSPSHDQISSAVKNAMSGGMTNIGFKEFIKDTTTLLLLPLQPNEPLLITVEVTEEDIEKIAFLLGTINPNFSNIVIKFTPEPLLEPTPSIPIVQTPLDFEEGVGANTFLVSGFHMVGDDQTIKAPLRLYFLGEIRFPTTKQVKQVLIDAEMGFNQPIPFSELSLSLLPFLQVNRPRIIFTNNVSNEDKEKIIEQIRAINPSLRDFVSLA